LDLDWRFFGTFSPYHWVFWTVANFSTSFAIKKKKAKLLCVFGSPRGFGEKMAIPTPTLLGMSFRYANRKHTKMDEEREYKRCDQQAEEGCYCPIHSK
jgi:hypothetical protein